jgi:hypothetical protein
MSRQRHFFIQTVGSRRFPRYRLVDCGMGFWTGTEWVPNEKRACLYHDFEAAAVDLREIKIREHADKTRRRFKAVVEVDLLGDRPLNLRQLVAHLAEAARLSLLEQPPGGMLVFVQIDWGTLQEVWPPDIEAG